MGLAERDSEKAAESGSVQELSFLIHYCLTRIPTLDQHCWLCLPAQKKHCATPALTADRQCQVPLPLLLEQYE